MTTKKLFSLLLLANPLFCFCQENIKIEEFFVLSGHSAGISSLAFSPDGKFLVSGSQDESLKIWDLSTKKVTRTITKFGSAPTSLAFSLNGDFLAVGQYAHIRVYETKKWRKKYQKEIFPAFVENIAVSPNGKQIAATSWKEKSLSLMDFPSLSNERPLKENMWTDALSFSSDGNLLLTGSHANCLKIWELPSGSLVNQFQCHNDWIYGCHFFDHDSKIVSIALDSQIVISEAGTGKKLLAKKMAHNGGISYSAISKNKKLLFTVSLDKTLKIWKLEDLELLAVFTEAKEKLVTMAVSADGKWAAAGGSDQKVYLIRLM